MRGLLTGVLGIVACLPVFADEARPHTPPAGQRLVGFYVGTLPCADCPGIRTELSLFAPEGKAGPASYWLKETYLGRPAREASFESGGGWTTQAGTHDPKATVYRLTEARSRENRFLLKVGDDELKMLDRSALPIESKLDYSLKRQAVAP